MRPNFSQKRLPQLVAEQGGDDFLQTLRDEVQRLSGSRIGDDCPVILGTGIAALDGLLSEQGLRAGSLNEWLSPSLSGAGLLALTAAREACFEGGSLVVVDRAGKFYPPSAAALGIDLEKVIVVRPASAADEVWAIDQSLRCEGVAAVWALVEHLDWRAFRRLQLAAESEHALGLIVRSSKWLGEPSWADTQFLVEPRLSSGPRRLRVQITRGRGPLGGSVELEIDEVTGCIREAISPHASLGPQFELEPAAVLRPA